MIHFISTFPPMMCGIGSYTSYLVSKLCAEHWKVTSFRLDEFLRTEQISQVNGRVSYEICLSSPCLPTSLNGGVIWFQHTFGLWGRDPAPFIQLVEEAGKRKAKVIASFHTIHFESDETDSGMSKKEDSLMRDVLPLLDAVTVFTEGSCRALKKAFPQYEDKIVTLRHGVHIYPQVSQEQAIDKLLRYLIDQATISSSKKRELDEMYSKFFSAETVFLGNFGYITSDKDPLALYELGGLIRDRFPKHRVIVLYVGTVQKRKDKKMEESLAILENLRSVHDGRGNLFFEDYLPEEILPYAFRALDFSVFWCHNATQSGRMAHAQGAGACVVGRKIEGVGETLDLAGLPAAVSLEDLAEKIGRFVTEPGLRKEAEKSSWRYVQEYSFEKQARKHLLLEKAVRSAGKLPTLDRTEPDITFILPRLALGKGRGLEQAPKEVTAFLNVADDVVLYPSPRNYHRIPLQDGVPVPAEKMREAISWIKRHIPFHEIIVFCRYGEGRSAAVIIGYLCAIGHDYQEAVKLVASMRPRVKPLPGLRQTIERALEGALQILTADAG